jgi:hypothetical protein
MKVMGAKRPPATAGLPFAKTEAVKKPNFQNHFENFSQLEALSDYSLIPRHFLCPNKA